VVSAAAGGTPGAGECLVARKGGQHRRELGAGRPAGQGEAERAQIAADGLQLSDQRARAVHVEALCCCRAKFREAFERRSRLWGNLREIRLRDERGKGARLTNNGHRAGQERFPAGRRPQR
jgi:hypothetical protein